MNTRRCRVVDFRRWKARAHLGQLQVGSHRHGKVDLVTPLSTFKLVVTAEQSSMVEEPSDYLILQGNIQSGS